MPNKPWIQRALWIAVFAPFVILALLRLQSSPRLDEEDYAHYLLHAQAIADGREYMDIGFIRTPLSRFTGPSARPPGLPLLLAPVVALGGVHSPLIPLVGIGLGLLFLVAASRGVAARESVPIAMAVGLMSGLQPNFVHFSTQAISDVPFAAMIWCVILVADRDEPWSAVQLLGITCAGVAALSFRLAGVALIPAMVAYGVLRFPQQRFRSLIPVLAWVGFFLLLSRSLPLTDAPPYPGAHAARSRLDSVLATLPIYGYGVLDTLLYPFGRGLVSRVYHVATLGLLAIGTVGAIRDYWRSFLALFTGAYVSMLLLVNVRDSRYLYPLIPVVILLTLRGLVLVLRRVRPLWTAQRTTVVAASCAVVVSLSSAAANWTPPRRDGVADRPDAQALFAALRALPASPTPRVATFKPRIISLESGVAAMPLLLGAPAVILRELCERSITHVVVGDLGIFPLESDQLRKTVAMYPSAFREAYRNASFTLLRFEPPPAESSTGSRCAATS